MVVDKGNLIRQQLVNDFADHPPYGLTEAEKAQIRGLLALYYQHLEASDLEVETHVDLLGGLIAHWQLARTRHGGATRVRVYNPNFEEHGWQSRHTIVEIVSRDMAFLVDSTSMALNNAGLTIFLTIHPVVHCVRDELGRLLKMLPPGAGKGADESMIRLHVDKQVGNDVLHRLEVMLGCVLQDVEHANRDWHAMQDRVRAVRLSLEACHPHVLAEELSESLAFLGWLEHGHFTFLAACTLQSDQAGNALVIEAGSLSGLFRRPEDGIEWARSTIPVFASPNAPFDALLLITKANLRSTVHRPAYMDFVGVKRFDEQGVLVGLDCFLGLFASSAYNSAPVQIPVLRKKVADVLAGTGVAPVSHSGRRLRNVLDSFPRDDLFQISTTELMQISTGILGLQERQRTRLFVRRDTFNRFYSCLLYLPRDRYNRELRLAVQDLLVETFQGTEVEFNAQFYESILARLHYIVHCPADAAAEFDITALEARIVEVTQTWQDGFKDALVETYDELRAFDYYNHYRHAFPGGFQEDYYPRTAVADIGRIEHARSSGGLAIHVYRPILEAQEKVHIRVYSVDEPILLSKAIPILENLGLTVFGERPYRIKPPDGAIWIHDFAMAYTRAGRAITDETAKLVQQTVLRVWQDDADNDGFNELVLAAGFSWRKIMAVRAYSRYLQQIRTPFSQTYIIESLVRNPRLATLLMRLFEARFAPKWESSADLEIDKINGRIESELEKVESLDQDRILRSLQNLVQATLRTNYFQSRKDDAHKSYISYKIDPTQVAGMPLPRPMFEIFVFSTHVEGVHLRGGPVARGGLRWSDRMEDYRTEILGLMKAQMVKNSLIVPVGSKGGFITKRLPSGAGRDALLEEVLECYQTLLRGMLDVTDNLVGGAVVVPPPQVRRHDADDPYLVVAADKGTATSSDAANAVAEEYGFWLGDAFASGGSAGYDHKKMGITARGAWESVKRHFRDLGTDVQTTDFRVIGIGDMAGDVFGNGMLLSRHIKLVGAFNHQHIFLDPEPDPEVAYKERERLFHLPRSSWEDYDEALISQGGGVHRRRAKFITLSEEVRAMLLVKHERLTPSALIRCLLQAPVDLLWNGGIGTFVKCASETDDAVHDKVNDGLRIDGDQLRCKVVGEGGNLGFTQLGRIAYAARGGRIYTDAIDNSGGVDCSDREVNIKILLGQVADSGDITRKQRDKLLEQMSDEVARLVLRDNYRQTGAINMVASRASARLYEHARFIDLMEQKGSLNRELEFLPSNKQIASRQANNEGLTKPEIAVLLSYSKMVYFDALMGSDIPDDEVLTSELVAYFPEILGERFGAEMRAHRLRREIIATHVANNIADRLGPGIGVRVREEVSSDVAGVVRAYVAARQIFSTEALYARIEALDNRVRAGVQTDMMLQISQLLERALTAILRSRRDGFVIRDVVEFYCSGVQHIADNMPRPLAAAARLDLNKQVRALVGAGVPRELAQRVAALTPMSSALDIVEVARRAAQDTALVAALYFRLGSALELPWLRSQINQLAVQSHWHSLARTKLLHALNDNHKALTAHILRTTKPYKNTKKMYEQWVAANSLAVDQYAQMVAELRAMTTTDFPMLSIAVNGVGDLLPAGG